MPLFGFEFDMFPVFTISSIIHVSFAKMLKTRLECRGEPKLSKNVLNDFESKAESNKDLDAFPPN